MTDKPTPCARSGGETDAAKGQRYCSKRCRDMVRRANRADLFNRWHSLALLIGTRAAGKTQTFDGSVGGSKSPPSPSASDWMERQELTGSMLRWLADMGFAGERIIEEMHVAITESTNGQFQRLLANIEDAEWLIKVEWKDGRHSRLTQEGADIKGRIQWERRIIMHFRGTRTEEVADEMGLSVGKVRWVRRKHGLTIEGERMYPCTLSRQNAAGKERDESGQKIECPACKDLNHFADEYPDDYENQEAA